MSGSPIAHHGVGAFLESLGAKQPVPGGGAAAGLVVATAAGLAEMVLRYSVGKKALEAHQPLIAALLPQVERHRRRALEIADEDATAYAAVNALWSLPREDPRRVAEWPDAVLEAVEVPVRLIDVTEQLLAICREMAGTTAKTLRSDLAIAAVLAEAGMRAAAWNVRINLPYLDDDGRAGEFTAVLERSLMEARTIVEEVEGACRGG